MKEIMICFDQSKNYISLDDALMDEGFVEIEECEIENTGFNYVYQRKEKYYVVLEWNHFNTTIYDAKLLEVDELGEFKSYYIDMKLKTLKEELLGKTLTLGELNSECQEILRCGTDINDYDMRDFMDEEGGSFAWNCNTDTSDAFNVEFDIVEDNEKTEEIVVKIDNIHYI